MVDMLEGREAGEEGAQFDSLHEALAQPGHRQLPGLPHQLGDEAVVPLHRWEEVWGLVPTQAILERIWWRLKKYTKYRNSGRPLYKLSVSRSVPFHIPVSVLKTNVKSNL